MSGKVLSILALSLMLSYLFVSACCQGVKSYTGTGPAAPYKQPLPGHNKYRTLGSQNDRANRNEAMLDSGFALTTGQSLAGKSLTETDSTFWYRGLTHDTVLAALKANH